MIKDVFGYEGLYKISDDGFVFSIFRNKLLCQWKNNQGYMFVTLRKNGIRKNRSIHSLILETFIGQKPSNKHQASHINGFRTDNRLENLRWLTVSQNHLDKKNHGTFQCGTKHGRSKLTEELVATMRSSLESHAYWARLIGVTPEAISYARNKGWKHV